MIDGVDELERKVSHEEFKTISMAIYKTIYLLSEKLEMNEIDIVLCTWSILNLCLLKAHKSFPKEEFQSVMNKTTMAQNKFLNEIREQKNEE